jgi:hypothetical protein
MTALIPIKRLMVLFPGSQQRWDGHPAAIAWRNFVGVLAATNDLCGKLCELPALW